jgi:pyruvate kinase
MARVNPEPAIQIISTLGPSLANQQTLRSVIRAGSLIFRQNIFYETTEEIALRAAALREAGRKEDRPVELMMDFSGGRPRMGSFEKPLNLRPGETLAFVRVDGHSPAGSEPTIPLRIDRETWEAMNEGERVIIADGRILLRILSREPGLVRCRIDRATAPLRPFRGVNLPDTATAFPPLTPEEIARLDELAQVGFDYFSLSFASKSEHLHQIRSLLESLRPEKPIRILAKIEDRRGLENLDELIEASDGILVGRGDLAVQTSFAELPELQETILTRCREKGAWVIVATQFMETMMRSPIPSRAEVMDVALAVRQGASAILLSGETARGRYPAETVAMVHEVAQRAAKRR